MSSRDVFLAFTRQKNYLRVKKKYQWVQDALETQQEHLWPVLGADDRQQNLLKRIQIYLHYKIVCCCAGCRQAHFAFCQVPLSFLRTQKF
jgi:hypothetical protein